MVRTLLVPLLLPTALARGFVFDEYPPPGVLSVVLSLSLLLALPGFPRLLLFVLTLAADFGPLLFDVGPAATACFLLFLAGLPFLSR